MIGEKTNTALSFSESSKEIDTGGNRVRCKSILRLRKGRDADPRGHGQNSRNRCGISKRQLEVQPEQGREEAGESDRDYGIWREKIKPSSGSGNSHDSQNGSWSAAVASQRRVTALPRHLMQRSCYASRASDGGGEAARC